VVFDSRDLSAHGPKLQFTLRDLRAQYTIIVALNPKGYHDDAPL